MTDDSRAYWNDQANAFDQEPDHGLADAETRAAWEALLLAHLPTPPAEVVDLGCGTGTLSTLLAGAGFDVRGLDFAPAMVDRARAKAFDTATNVEFVVGDAAEPPYPAASCDVVLSRHVLWAMPDAGAAIDRWLGLVRPGGRLVLVEGRWHTGGGIAADSASALLRSRCDDVELVPMPEAVYWGGPITDERYLLTGRRPA